ncbi:hypothetical protein ACO2Q8_07870 [Larkinella sp. VNQ87]|uniref:hypothetical protein n=1 Tax=Larkinella sp. VNQ87 TaxID=3400921 RepID=UPI003C0AE691
MKRFFRNAYRETKTTLLGLLLLGVGIFIALQEDVETALKTTLATLLVGAGIGLLGAKDPQKQTP